MRKLKLDELTVDSFDTGPQPHAWGTVRPHQAGDTNTCYCYQTVNAPTCKNSCTCPDGETDVCGVSFASPCATDPAGGSSCAYSCQCDPRNTLSECYCAPGDCPTGNYASCVQA